MSRMNRSNWEAYAALRSTLGKAAAESYRHKVNSRNALRMVEPDREPDWKIVKDYGIDGYLAKCFFPGFPNTRNLIDDLWIEPVYSAYDCTGCMFTSWIECFPVPGGVWVYHRISCDI